MIKQFSKEELFERIRRVRLKGHGQPAIYEHAHLVLVTLEVASLMPAQAYVLQSSVDAIRLTKGHLRLPPNQIEAFELDGFVEVDGIPFLPPIVETSVTKSGRQVLLVNDGMHRVWVAERSGFGLITCVLASNLPPEYPYYAWPLENGWDSVQLVNERPEVKKDYREEDYKALFRDFNAQFPGVQADRSAKVAG